MNELQRQNLQAIVDIVFECRTFGQNNGHPAPLHYSRYPALRAIGEQLHEYGGQRLLAKMLNLLEAEIGGYDDGEWASAAFVSSCWNDIGTWQR